MKIFKIKKDKKNKKIIEKLKSLRSKEKDVYTFEEVIIVMIFSLGLGFLCCLSFVKIFSNSKNYLTLATELNDFVEAYNTINDKYYGEIDKDKLIENAINGMVSSVGDIYTNYSNSDNTATFNETVKGVYDGIGCTISMDENNNIVVVEVFANSPASVAGIKVNDIILKVDGEDYTNKTSTDMSEYVKNSAKSTVKLVIKRDNKELTIKIKKKTVEIPIIDSEIYEKNNKKIGYISISLFSSVSDTQFIKELANLESQGINGLVIDVRDNGGGYLSAVTNIASSLLKKGEPIYQLEDSTNNIIITKDETKEKRTYHIAVIINGSSASASEILASAIKESYGGYVVGTNSYGKGTVQQTTNLSNGSMLKYTVEKWLTPKGNWIDGVGVDPTNYVELNEEYYNNPTIENDNQLNEALTLVSK